ncbi:MAG TPA: hypothetical protein VJ801_14420 [Polyangia bacterium]|nr:hypothetical protein [Polyangia bacterium]
MDHEFTQSRDHAAMSIGPGVSPSGWPAAIGVVRDYIQSVGDAVRIIL